MAIPQFSFVFTSGRKLKVRKAYRTSIKLPPAFILLLAVASMIVLVVECRHHEADDDDQFQRRHRRYPDNFSNSSGPVGVESKSENNNGFFVQIPHSNPPTVRPPPYTISHEKCPPLNVRENWIDTLCGDLNTGLVPQNPLGHKFFDGGTYPFETIKNKTLDFFRRALPILKSDKSLPKVAKFAQIGNYAAVQPQLAQHLYRAKRGIATREPADPNPLLFDASYPDSFYYDDPAPVTMLNTRQRRQHTGSGAGGSGGNGFCENRLMGYYNRLCKLYNAMWGKTPHNIQRDHSGETRRQHGSRSTHHPHSHPGPHYPSSPHHQLNSKKHFRQAFHTRPDMTVEESDWTKASKLLNTGGSITPATATNSVDMPPTPCPSAAEYLTPVFARNHEGAWRYVVQIPKEGYFTQTVEVTKCLKSNCFYMDGSCKTSPRWQSLLVAELFYPDTTFPTTAKPYSTPKPPTPIKQTTTTIKPASLALSSILGDQENYPDYLYSKGQSSASLENLSAGVNYSNELGLPFKKRSVRSVKEDSSSSSSSKACDGYDDVGCYQVRLFYDWFLIPGSCKCWKRQFDFTLRSNHG